MFTPGTLIFSLYISMNQSGTGRGMRGRGGGGGGEHKLYTVKFSRRRFFRFFKYAGKEGLYFSSVSRFQVAGNEYSLLHDLRTVQPLNSRLPHVLLSLHDLPSMLLCSVMFSVVPAFMACLHSLLCCCRLHHLLSVLYKHNLPSVLLHLA